MAIVKYKPTTNARRGMTSQDNSAITTNKPHKSLTVILKKSNGRNNQGRITTRHKGGSNKRKYRLISFNLAAQLQAKVMSIEYDPNRTARIAKIFDETNQNYYYILATTTMSVGQKIAIGESAAIESGNRLAIKDIPVGSNIHAIEIKLNKGAQLVRSAGSSAQLVSKDDKYAQVKLPSGEIRLVDIHCFASLGVVGNEQHQNISIGKAGRNRHKGIRPTVRGVVMNAVDHPHGGGDGGRHRMAKAPRTPWGQKTLGYKTRKNRSTGKYIVRSRHESRRK